MGRRLGALLMTGAVWLLVAAPWISFSAEKEQESLKPYPVNMSLVSKYLEKHGVKPAEMVKSDKDKVISYKANLQGQGSTEAIVFIVQLSPKEPILMVECQGLAPIPTDSNDYYKLLDRINQLNVTQVLGKYCVDRQKNKVVYFYSQTVVGGMSYADFDRTLKMIEYAVFNNLKALRDLKS
jgi:hypothetical protein